MRLGSGGQKARAEGRWGNALLLAMLACSSCAPARQTPSAIVDLSAMPTRADPSVFAAPPVAALPRQADFLNTTPSANARLVADWVVTSGDNAGLPFAIIDKPGAKVYVFDAAGRLRGASFALLGLARGDNSMPGIGEKKLSAIAPDERTTPAGRFVAELGVDGGQSVLWVDYHTAIAMHPVVRGTPGDHRVQRLASPSVLDKRITFGCINVPPRFFYDIVFKTFSGTVGIVYTLPDTEAVQDVFPAIMADNATMAKVATQIR